MDIKNNKLRNLLYQSIKEFVRLFLVGLFISIFLNISEVLLNGFTHQFPEKTLNVLAIACFNTLIFWLEGVWLAYMLFLVLYYFSKKIAITTSAIFIFIITLAQLILINYFNVSLLPLGADIYGYSFNDIKQTVGASDSLNIVTILLFVIVLILVVSAIVFLPKRINISPKIALLFPLISIILIPINTNSITNAVFQSDYANNLAVNKLDYFSSASFDYFFPTPNDVDIYQDSYINAYENLNSEIPTIEYLNESEYPFLHKAETADVLSPFLVPTKTPPNIVIILVEGLGRAFTNDGAYLGNFTPFVDSLANESLYWKNFLSAGGRTFAVLPSIMGSLPFAKNGFLEANTKMNDHLSLFSILKSNNYHTSFYYGGDSKFDNMKMFLAKNKVDEIHDGLSFPSGYKKLPSQNGFTWGYADDQLFNYYFSTRKQQLAKPELNVILTVSTHNPFLINNQDKYLKLFEQRMSTLKFSEEKKETYRNYKLQYSSILYTDEALRDFFLKYKKRSDYANTIFLITGDHRLPEIPLSSKIDRYHVPLILFSPLLKRTAQMESISTHFDIAPTVLAYLKSNFKLKIPNQSSWLGTGLDTARNFRNIHETPLIQTKTDLVDFVMGEYHLNGNTLFKLQSDLNEIAVVDDELLNKAKNKFDNFKKKNSRIINGAKILPDSLIKKYAASKN